MSALLKMCSELSKRSELSKQNLTRLVGDTDFVRDLALRFDDIQLRVSILSAYELKESKGKGGFRPRREIVTISALS